MTDGDDGAEVGGGSPGAQDGDAVSSASTEGISTESTEGTPSEPADAADLRALREDVAGLEETLQDLQSELQGRPRRRFRPPGLRELRRLTTEVTIPMTILVLETNVRALRILRRALDEESATAGRGAGETAGRVGRRAADVSGRALDRLGDALADLQESVAPAEEDESLDGLLDEAASLQDRVESQLQRVETGAGMETDAPGPDDGDQAVAIDVDAELESIRSEIDDEDDNEDA
jgi:hypothetical protein